MYVCVLGFDVYLWSAGWDEIHTCWRFSSQTLRNLSPPHFGLSLSRCQIFRDPISTIMLVWLPFSNFYVNLFLTSALGFKADSFPTEMCSFSFYNLLHFLIFLSSHAVLFSLLFPSSVSHSPLLWLCLLSYCFYTSHYKYRIIGVVVEILHGAREKHHEKHINTLKEAQCKYL